MSDLLNFTPHDIILYDPNARDKIVLVIPREHESIRLDEEKEREILYHLDDIIPVSTPPKYHGLNRDIPKNKGIIVSQLVAEFLLNQSRDDYPEIGRIYVPDTGNEAVVRNEKGQIIGTTRLIQYL